MEVPAQEAAVGAGAGGRGGVVQEASVHAVAAAGQGEVVQSKDQITITSRQSRQLWVPEGNQLSFLPLKLLGGCDVLVRGEE